MHAEGRIEDRADLRTRDYGQHAVICTARAATPHGGTAWIIGDLQERVYPVPVEGFGIRGVTEWGIKPENNGPAISRALARVKVKDSRFDVVFQLKAGQPWVDVRVEGAWLSGQRAAREVLATLGR